MARAFSSVLVIALCGCAQSALPPLSATLVNTRFDVPEGMRAGREMQLSGEPFAEILNYNLGGFDRTSTVTDQYDPCLAVGNGSCRRTDPLGYALAVESYEYSKQPMNNLSFESGAGLSLMFGPVLNPMQQAGDPAFNLLLNRFQLFAAESNAGGPAGTNLIVSPAPSLNHLNYYGWPGLWPVMAEFTDFDPAIAPQPGQVNNCTPGAGAVSYGGAPAAGSILIANYECDYNSLNLPNRAQQTSMAISPASLGYPVWKQGLWVINYWGTLQDTAGNPIIAVAAADLPQVGQPNNTVVGQYPDPNDPTGETLIAGAPGVYLGDIPMEGWQGLTMVEEIDNKSALILSQLLTGDGATLRGVTSLADALDYSYDSGLLFVPAKVQVTETAYEPQFAVLQTKYFPQPTAFAITDGSSQLSGLSGLVGGFAEAFAFTDANNAQVGGSTPWLATFDGDPFPGEDPTQPYGQSTLHDRALAILKIGLLDFDRIHFNARSNVLVDAATISGGYVVQGTTVTTHELAEAVLALRNGYRALNGTLQLYSNDTPDTIGAATALDSMKLTGATFAGGLPSRVLSLIQGEADFLSVMLIDGSGAVANGYDLAAGAPDPSPTVLEAEVGALRALLDAYLSSGNDAYRDRAMQVYQDLDARFWMPDVMAYRTTAGVDSPLQYTPARIGALTGALRQYYKLVASGPARAAEGQELLQRLKRIHKLVLNGWNDLNQDDTLQFPSECLPARLEMAERYLTGELGHYVDNGDRDSDCIRELSLPNQAGVAAGDGGTGLPAALASELDITRE